MLRIAFSAKAGSGKSEAVKIVSEILGVSNCKNVKFADPLYDIMYMIQDYMGIERSKDGRLLQLIGTDWGRERDANIWTNKFQRTVESTVKSSKIILCDDVRMKNELELVNNLGFFVIRINRPEHLRKGSLVGRDMNHSSETELDSVPDSSFDWVIENNTNNLKKLRSQVKLAVMTAISKQSRNSLLIS